LSKIPIANKIVWKITGDNKKIPFEHKQVAQGTESRIADLRRFPQIYIPINFFPGQAIAAMPHGNGIGINP
jgi:hypothetical protein